MTRSLLHGGRWLIRRPLVSLTSALCLAVGISSSVAAWTLLDAVVLRPFGLEDSDRLMVVWETDPARGQELIEVSYLNFLDWQRDARTVETMAAFGSQHWPALARFGTDMVPLATRGVTTSFFSVLGVQPAFGRGFEPRDADPTAPPPLLLSHRLWQTRFNSQTSAVGQKVFLDGTDHLIVGVMPRGFAYPDDPDAWVSVERILGEAFQNMSAAQQRMVGVLEVLAKRKSATTTDDVRAELTTVIRALRRQHAAGAGDPTTAAAVTPFAEMIVGRLGQRIWIAVAMSLAVLLLACTNVATTRIAHLRERAVELGARLSLGATPARLFQHLAGEGVGLVAIGAAGATVLWQLLIELISTSAAIDASGVTLSDRWTLGIARIALLSAVSWLLTAVLPAVVATRWRGLGVPQGTPRVMSGTGRLGAPLLLGQAAMAIAVVALAGAALQTFQRLSRIDLGFSTRGVTLVDFALPAWKYKTPEEHRDTRDRLQVAVRTIPSVAHVAAVSIRPFRFGEIVDGLPVRRGGDALVQPDEATSASRVAVTPDYFRAIGQLLVEGRHFNPFDRRESEAVVIISRTLARSLFGDRSAVGQYIDTFTLSEKWRSRLVVGVTGDAQYRGLERPSLEVYVPHTQTQASLGSLVIASNSAVSESDVRRALRSVEPDVAIEGFQTTAELRASVLSPARLLTTIVSLLGGAGLLLLTLGVFSAAAAALRASWPEIAVRQAIGARPFQAARAPLKVLTRALCAGVLLGIGLSPMLLAAARVFGVGGDEGVLVSLAIATLAVGVAAALAILPSLRRAATAPPAELLRRAQSGVS